MMKRKRMSFSADFKAEAARLCKVDDRALDPAARLPSPLLLRSTVLLASAVLASACASGPATPPTSASPTTTPTAAPTSAPTTAPTAAATSSARAPASAIVFVPLPPPLPLDGAKEAAPSPTQAESYEDYRARMTSQPRPIRPCKPPDCDVIRDAAHAPPELAGLVAEVDFTRSMLVRAARMATGGHGPVAYDAVTRSLPDGSVVVELPAHDCGYCGGVAPGREDELQSVSVVIRVPKSSAAVRVRERPAACPPCDPRLP